MAAAFFVGAYLAYRSFKKTSDYRLQAALRSAKTVPIARAVDGQLTKIAGEVEPGDKTLEAPLSGKRCVGYRVRVTQGERTIVDEHESVDFRVRDRSGTALVSTKGAQTLFDWDENYGEGTFEDESTTPELGRFMRQYGGLPPGGNVRYSEGMLEPGETAHVLGTARREGPDVVLCKHEDAPLYVADAALIGRWA